MIRDLLLPEKQGIIIADHRDMGGNYCFRGIQNSGKTLGMVLFIFRLIYQYGYKWSDVTANFHLFLDRGKGTSDNGFEDSVEPPGFRYMDNERIKKWVRKVYRKSEGKIKDQIIAIDEIDQVYSHKMSNDSEDIEDVLSLWQDQKLSNYFLYTKHIGRGCNILIRQATEVSMKPIFLRRFDTLYLDVLDGFVMQEKFLTFRNASRFYNNYWRWEPIH